MRLLCHEFGGGHLMRLKKSKFETLYCFLRQLIPEVPLETIVTLRNEAYCEGPGCEAPRNYAWFCMILWGASYVLCIPLKEPDKTKNEVPQKFSMAMMPVMPCLGITSCWDNVGPNYLSFMFGKTGDSFRSPEELLWVQKPGVEFLDDEWANCAGLLGP